MQAEASEQAVRVVREVRVVSVRVVQAERVVRSVRVGSVCVVQAERFELFMVLSAKRGSF